VRNVDGAPGMTPPPRKTRAELDELGFKTQAEYDAWYYDLLEQSRANRETAREELEAALSDPERRARLMKIVEEQQAKRREKERPHPTRDYRDDRK
jgi:hypothetical protein